MTASKDSSQRSNTVGSIPSFRPSPSNGGQGVERASTTFDTSHFDGTGSFSIPLPLPPCRGLDIGLSIEYSSGNGNGSFGHGFSVSLSSIQRNTSRGTPRYDGDDQFMLDGVDLVPVAENAGTKIGEYRVTQYRPRIDRRFELIEYWEPSDGGCGFWKVVDQHSTMSIYGYDVSAQIVNPSVPEQVFSWLLQKQFDSHGNAAFYVYRAENGKNIPNTLYEHGRDQRAAKYIEQVLYGNDTPLNSVDATPSDTHCRFQVLFDYSLNPVDPADLTPNVEWAARPDPFSIYHTGFELRQYRLCHNIRIYHDFTEIGPDPSLVLVTQLAYSTDPDTIKPLIPEANHSLLTTVTETGYRQDVVEKTYETASFPSMKLSYTSRQAAAFHPLSDNTSGLGARIPARFQFVDLYGEGAPGLLYSQGTSFQYRGPVASVQGQCGPSYALEESSNIPDIARTTTDHYFVDITGDGLPDLVCILNGTVGYFLSEGVGQWGQFQVLPHVPTEFHAHGVRFADLTGDGLSDLVVLGNQTLRFYRSLGAKGFEDPIDVAIDVRLPDAVATGAKESLLFADVLGAGTVQLVRVCDGNITCWPSLGFGDFDEPIQVADVPMIGAHYDATRVFLEDVTGTGAADLLIAHSDRLDVYINKSGNRFSKPISIPLPATFSQLSTLAFEDLRGNGNQCIVFSNDGADPKHWFCDLCDNEKPALLAKIDNQLGGTTEIQYSSSTSYYLNDKQSGHRWFTRLANAVQVVAQVTHIDTFACNNTTDKFSYRHGYFDPDVREFRGFARIEQNNAQSVIAQKNSPPVRRMIAWYHNGLTPTTTPLESWLCDHEYFQGDHDAYVMRISPIHFLGHSKDAMHEAHYSLGGQLLREEVYGIDGSTDAKVPYTIKEHNYSIIQLQTRDDNRFGIYRVDGRETIAYDYERVTTDPRIGHAFVLNTDPYGHVTESAVIHYPRRKARAIKKRGFEAQNTLQCLYQDHVFFQSDKSFYLAGIPIEARQYDLRLTLASGNSYFDFDSARCAVDTALQSVSSRRLITWDRQYYADGSQPFQKQELPFRTVNQQALPCRVERAQFSNFDIAQWFQGVDVPGGLKGMLSGPCGYVSTVDTKTSDTYWLNPGERSLYNGASAFYRAAASVDPLGRATRNATYDPYYLFVTKTDSGYLYDVSTGVFHTAADVLQNEESIKKIDYQALRPAQTRDINKNTFEFLFDPLGRTVVETFYGMENGDPVGFSPLSKYQPLPPPKSLTDLLHNESQYLKNVAAFYFYADDSDFLKGGPAFDVTMKNPVYSTNTNVSANVREEPRVEIEYWDGHGRSLAMMKKVELDSVGSKGPGITEVTPTSRWLISGRHEYDIRGKVCREYEPYYVQTPEFVQAIPQDLSTPYYEYDALGRNTRTYTPKDDLAKAFFRESVYVSVWQVERFDENDTVTTSPYYKKYIKSGEDDPSAFEKQALKKAAVFDNTPTIESFDNMGRMIQVLETAPGSSLEPGADQSDSIDRATYRRYDILGRLVWCADARMFALGSDYYNLKYIYAMSGEAMVSCLIDEAKATVSSGKFIVPASYGLNNANGLPLFSQNPKGIQFLTDYDGYGRRIQLTVFENGKVTVPEKISYGDTVLDGQKPLDPEANNLRGKIHIHDDGAGRHEFTSYAITGQLLAENRSVVNEYEVVPDYASGKPAYLETCPFKTEFTVNALGEKCTETDPDGNVICYGRYVSGRIRDITLLPKSDAESPEFYVKQYVYNARGDCTYVAYGNNVTTNNKYDPMTYRLTSISTLRSTKPKKLNSFLKTPKLQDLSYTYDPVGNVSHIDDALLPPSFFANSNVIAGADYFYNPFYELITAVGRECIPSDRRGGESSSTFGVRFVHPNDISQVQQYTRHYKYDRAGNRYQVKSVTNQSSWIRNMAVSNVSNRAVAMTGNPGKVEQYFDANGNQISLKSLETLSYDYRNCNVYSEDLAGNTQYCVYDASGQRVRKVSANKGSGQVTDVLYIGTFEIHRQRQGGSSSILEEYHSKKIESDQALVALRIDWKKRKTGSLGPKLQQRFQLLTEIGSVSLEVDSDGSMITYEHYYPYGGTAFATGSSAAEVKFKEYRYSSKERDSLTGLYYYGARYYIPENGRWMAADPSGPADGLNLYAFVSNNPVRYHDPDGRGKKEYQGYLKSRRSRERARTRVRSMRARRDQLHDMDEPRSSRLATRRKRTFEDMNESLASAEKVEQEVSRKYKRAKLIWKNSQKAKSTRSAGSFWKSTIRRAKLEAPQNSTHRWCPTCGETIASGPGASRVRFTANSGHAKRNFQLDHFPDTIEERHEALRTHGQWTSSKGDVFQIDLDKVDQGDKAERKIYNDMYNTDLRLQCQECNISHKYEHGEMGDYLMEDVSGEAAGGTYSTTNMDVDSVGEEEMRKYTWQHNRSKKHNANHVH